MASGDHSFIDIAVHEEVRERFAAGDALVMLDVGLREVIWANGPGAALFGHDDIEAIIGAEPQLGAVAKRQIMAISGYPDIGRDRALMVRMTSGLASLVMPFQANGLVLPGGDRAILLAVPAAGKNGGEVAARVISGLSQPGQFVALVGKDGTLDVASTGFAGLGIAQETLAGLAGEVAAQRGRLVKKMIPAGKRRLPAGIARLTDTAHLLLVIDEESLGEIEPVAATEARAVEPPVMPEPAVEPPAEEPAKPEPAMEPFVAAQPEPEPPAEAPARTMPAFIHTPAEPLLPDAEALFEDELAEAISQGVAADGEEQQPVGPEVETQPVELKAPAEVTTTPGETVAVEPADTAATPPPLHEEMSPPAERASGPIRFVWRTDAEGKFSALSPEFATAVGVEAANVLGLDFRDVCKVFGMDPDGDIAGLLERRDTWSGRSLLWPVAGTDLRIPVDLAALPVYDRARNFEGFRGFGVARAGDAMVDPDAIGLTLVEPSVRVSDAPEEPKGAETPPEPIRTDPFQGEPPVLTIVPKPDRRFTDKVIRLAEHRAPANDRGLTPVERNAFREIGDRLRSDSGEADKAAAEMAAAPGEAAAPIAEEARPASASASETAAAAPVAAAAPLPEAAEATVAEATSAATKDPAAAEIVPETASTFEPEAAKPAEPAADAPASKSHHRMLGRMDDAPPVETPTVVTVLGEAETATVAEAKAIDETAVPLVSEAPAEPMQGAPIFEAVIAEPVTAESAAPETFEPAAIEEPIAEPEPETPVSQVAAISHAVNQTEPIRLVESATDGEGHDLAASANGTRRPPVDTSILDRLPIPVLIHSGDVLHYANREFLEFTAYDSVEELAARGGLGELFAEPYPAEGEDGDRKLRLRRGDELELPVEAFLQSVPWNGGKALLLSLRRIGRAPLPMPAQPPAPPLKSEEKLALEALITELGAIVDTATDGVILIAENGIIRSISRPAEALFGFDSADVAGKPFISLFAIESQRTAKDYLYSLSDNGVASVLNDGREVIGREAQGRFIPLFMTIGRLPNKNGYCAVLRDITQWKRAEEDLIQARAQAERASSQKTEFLARVSHEIRTPLNAIIGFSELMMDEKFGPIGNDRYRDYLRDINRSGNHVLDLVNDLLDISKIEAGQQEMNYEAVSLNDTLSESVALMQPQANRERVIIRSSFASGLPEVVADLRTIRQIALNLLSNAIRYTPAGGQVIVSTAYETSGDVVLRFRDTGIGMSGAEIEQALKPFKQINAIKRPRGDGTGLGLPLTKAMVEANRARFSIQSTPGEGTLVEITFPSTRVLAA